MVADARTVAVVGSGFGGSVAALRLAQKGYRVVVLEQGRRLASADLRAGATDPQRLAWAPALGLRGYLATHVFSDAAVLGGVGVGGGSLVYGAVLLEPPGAVFDRLAWRGLGIDWARELAPHYATAARMLGRTETPHAGPMDHYLRATARALGAGESFGPTPTGIYYGERPGAVVADPYFGGEGPARTACTRCGGCLAGCPIGAKNSLDLSYLHLAETRGARVLPRHRVDRIEPVAGGYRLAAVDPLTGARQPAVVAARVVVAAGVVGTVELLLRARDHHRTLPGLSDRLGRGVRTNSEAIVGVEHRDPPPTLGDGPAISSHFYADALTHVTQNRLAAAQAVLRLAATPMVDDARPLARAVRTLLATVRRPRALLTRWLRSDWHRRVTVLTVMQHVDSELALELVRSLRAPFRRRLDTRLAGGRRPPTYLPVANRAARALATATGGEPFSLVAESVGNRSITAHILGGCALSRSAADGVIDTDHQVHGYPGLYVVDGSALPANIGVNPSLTIAALAERCVSRIPPPPDREASTA